MTIDLPFLTPQGPHTPPHPPFPPIPVASASQTPAQVRRRQVISPSPPLALPRLVAPGQTDKYRHPSRFSISVPYNRRTSSELQIWKTLRTKHRRRIGLAPICSPTSRSSKDHLYSHLPPLPHQSPPRLRLAMCKPSVPFLAFGFRSLRSAFVKSTPGFSYLPS